jgi:hypothetical protein
MSPLHFYTISSKKTGVWLVRYGDSQQALEHLRLHHRTVFLTIEVEGESTMSEVTTNPNAEAEAEAEAAAPVKAAKPKKEKAAKPKKEKAEPKPRGSGIITTCREKLEMYRPKIESKEMARKDVINALVEQHGINRGTANVQYGIVFGTTPRQPKA